MNSDNERINSGTKESVSDSYYEGVSSAFRYAKFITLTLAVVFVILTLSFFREDVSIENFQYMLKYITNEEDTLITTQKLPVKINLTNNRHSTPRPCGARKNKPD